MKFRKKPVVVKAMQFTEQTKNQVFNWITVTRYADHENENPILVFRTAHGDDAIARLGDWVIRGPQGDFYPCKPDIFDATYEPVEDEAHERGES